MEHQKPFLEVFDTEKELLIYLKKGSLDDEVLKLYRRIRSRYENILLNNNTSVQYHEIEYHLWKLHYKLIDEFRKIIRQRSSEKPRNDTVSDSVNSSSGDADHKTFLEKYQSFLSESADFYTNLIIKLRKSFGFPAEIFLGKDSYGSLVSVEKAKLDTCQHSCHRLLVCLGDLVRYSQSCKKPEDSDWSAAAKYYLEAAKIWPESGNPHNQLALLATYVDDPFLALYHLVRSWFVKEPFPDAWRNILLLFDESRSAELKSLSRRMQFNFLNPSEKVSLQKLCNEENRSNQNDESQDFSKRELWPILVRTLSFFFMRSSFEEFQCLFASTIHSLEALLEQDDANLFASLESYQRLDPSKKKGPYRAIQIVTIFIFMFHYLTETSETEKSISTEKPHDHSEMKPLVISAVFICMGRLIERCATRNQNNSCPVLPAVLVFLEWLVEKLDVLNASYDDNDKRVVSSLSYFLVSLSDLLHRMDPNVEETASDRDNSALWEDHELRGFYPLIHIHKALDYGADPEFSHDSNRIRCQRVFLAASRILVSSVKGIIHNDDELGRTLNSVKTLNLIDQEAAAAKPSPNQETGPNSIPKAQQHQAAEEEIIVFKPITRRYSEPITETKSNVSDESLRRATSLYNAGQNQVNDSSFSFHKENPFSFRKENPYKDSPGPPSLSAWVPPGVGAGSNVITKDKTRDKPKLKPIEETPSSSTIAHSSSLPRTMPIPSAPLLPEEPVWLTGNSVISSDYYRGGIVSNEGDGILGAAPRLINTGPGIPNLIDNYSSYPPIIGMSSSEWLYHYRNSHNLAMNQSNPIHPNARAFGNYNPNEISGFDSYDQWGNRFVSGPMHHYLGSPLIYPTSSYGYERSSSFPYVLGVGDELSAAQPTPLLQYLKERERQLQQLNTGTQFKNL